MIEHEHSRTAKAPLKVQIVSDLHLEFGNPLPPRAEGADIVVCAGDLAPLRSDAIERAAQRWAGAQIVYVPGNHEFYGSDIDAGRAKLAERCERLGVALLAPGTFEHRNVRFIGATLWTDFGLDGVAAEPGAHRAARAMRDFDGHILHARGTGRWTTRASARRHEKERAFIERALDQAGRDNATAVVVTHHAPTARSIGARYQDHPTNPAFASDLEGLIARHQPALWVHGHVHTSVDVTLGATRVVANPGGYDPAENPGYDPGLCIEVR